MLRPLLVLPLRIQRHKPTFLLDPSHHLLLRTRMKHKSALPQQQLQILRHIPSRHIDPADTRRHSEAFVDRHSVRDAVAAIEHYACGAAGSVEGEHSLNGGMEGGHVEGFEEDLRGGFTVGAWIQRWFSQQDRML